MFFEKKIVANDIFWCFDRKQESSKNIYRLFPTIAIVGANDDPWQLFLLGYKNPNTKKTKEKL